MNIRDILALPRHIIRLQTLNHADEILQYCKRNQIRWYAYEFRFKQSVIKYGYSMSGLDGERVYRQAWYIPGWATIPTSHSGADMQNIIKKNPQHFKNIHKDDVELVIYDLTGYCFYSNWDNGIKQEVKNVEALLMENHIEQFGKLPPGNERQEPVKPIVQINELFEFS